MSKRLFAFLATVLLFLAGCGEVSQPVETTAPPEESTLDPVLEQRRDIAESYMRSMLTVVWSPEEDILYALDSKDPAESEKQMLLRADRVYQGMPYSFAGSTLASFLDYCQPDGDIYTLTGIHWKALSGSSALARIGIDGSSALALSWCQVANSVKLASTKVMVMENGFLPVGTYKTTKKELANTLEYSRANGEAVMYESYSQMLKADGLVRYTPEGSQAMMAVSVSTVYNEDGTVDPQKSTVTVLEQNKAYFLDEIHSYNEDLGCEVYQIGGIDVVYSFADLYTAGYLPVTCKELTDPEEPLPAKIGDTNRDYTWETCLKGFIDCNHPIDSLTATFYDDSGNVVQEATLRAVRTKNTVVPMDRFLGDDPDTIRGWVDPEQLGDGAYRYVLVCRLINGQEFTVRDFTFRTDD